MRTILIVDTNQDTRCNMKRLIHKAVPDAAIHSFDNVDKVRDYILEDTMDVVFINLVSLGVKGIILAQEMREKQRRTNIIFVAASYEFATEAINIHASGYVNEPVTVQKLKEELTNLRSA